MGFGRIRLRRVVDTSAASLLPFVKDCVEPGSVVRTDGSWAYHQLPKLGYRRDRNVMLAANDPAHVARPSIPE